MIELCYYTKTSDWNTTFCLLESAGLVRERENSYCTTVPIGILFTLLKVKTQSNQQLTQWIINACSGAYGCHTSHHHTFSENPKMFTSWRMKRNIQQNSNGIYLKKLEKSESFKLQTSNTIIINFQHRKLVYL